MRAELALGIGTLAAMPLAATSSAPLEAADAFVRSIYQAIPTSRFDYRNIHYTAELAGWMRRDQAAANNEVGVIDSVPFCECQDNDRNYRIVRTRVTSSAPNRARVVVTLRNGDMRDFTVDLVGKGKQWRVADIHGPNTPSLLAVLRREVPRAEASHRRH